MSKDDRLYRKKNTTARGAGHRLGGDYRHQRTRDAGSDARRGAMHSHQHGFDYTPLFRFLLSKVGSPWDQVHSEAVSRLDRPDPMFWMVARSESEQKDFVLMGETSYYSGLYVDAEGILRKVNAGLGPQHMTPSCSCCTHTFNGVRFS